MIGIQVNIQRPIGNILNKFDAIDFGSITRKIALNRLAEIQERIHEKGQASDGGDIGGYSTEPIYVSAKNNVGRSFGRPIGKTGKSKFKSGEDHKSRYFAGGYNEYKTTIGRNEIGKVNLSLSGQMNSQLTVMETANGYGIGWPNAEMKSRAIHFEKKYGKKIWSLSKKELEHTISEAKKMVSDALH